MAQLAIKGHETRGEEVIEILEMLGGKNKEEYTGENNHLWYYINERNEISIFTHSFDDCNFFTLEEFLEKYPYKVGDKVIYKSEVFPIIGMKWNCCRNIVIYTMKNNCSIIDCYDSTWMKSYKEETMEEIKIDIPKGYEFVGVDDDAQQVVLQKTQPEYPKTYEECCKALNLTKYPPALAPNKSMFISQYEDFPYYYEIQKFAQLLVCRDAYWKIAGEQMGLGKPWEPDWTNNYRKKWIINFYQGEINLTKGSNAHFVLAFPTAEMRDAFYENFKGLIENCKEFL